MKKKISLVLKTCLIPENHFINIDLDHSIPYDKRIVWTKEEKNSTVQIFVDKIYYELGIDAPEFQSIIKKITFNNIVCNLISGIENGRLIAVAFGKSAYKMPKIYGMRHYSYHFTVKFIRKLEEKGYIKVRKGYYDRIRKEGKVSRIWATEKMREELKESSFLSATLASDTENYFDRQNINLASNEFSKIVYDTPILLKDKRKNYIDYETTDEIEKAKIFLERYNDFISRFNIYLPLIVVNASNDPECNDTATIDIRDTNDTASPLLGKTHLQYHYNKKLDCRLYRVFNNGMFDEGGRFYGADYQQLSEKKRIEILINGNEVVEIDYSGLHGRMVYQYSAKIDYQEDPYDVKGNEELRDAFKKMFQMIINAKGRVRAIEAFKKSLKEEDDGEEIKRIMDKHHATPEWLFQKMTEKHKEIEMYFGTGIGIKLQFIDSQIAESILKHFTFKRIPCLCIHDSFIVEKKYQNELIEVMKQEYKNKIGFDCQLKINERVKK